MPSTYSTNLKIELMATGENSGTWGNVTNTNLGTALEQAVIGLGNPNYASDANLTISLTDSNASQAARALVLNVTSSVSLSATRELVVPTIQKQYIVQNNTTGSQSITVKTAAGTGITIPSGKKAHLYVDGTNVIQMFDYMFGNMRIDANNTVAALSLVQTGTGPCLLAEDSTSPDSTPTVIDTNGNIILGKSSRQAGVANKAEVHSTTTETSGLLPSIGLYNWNANASARPYLSFFHYTSGTVGTVAGNASGDNLGTIRFFTRDSSTGDLYQASIDATTASSLTAVDLSYTANSHAFSGPITSGTWNGSAIGVPYGGTGITSGTSGGVPYFSASNTIASSAALAANALVIGGGAGVAPSTTTTGANVLTALGNAANSTGGFTTINGTATLTNKRIDPRVSSTTSTASITPDISSFDQYAVTAQAATLTINAPIGTPVDGNRLIFRILDNGVSRTLNWNGTFTAIGVTIPTATTAGKMTYIGCIYNAANTRWDVVAVTTQF